MNDPAFIQIGGQQREYSRGSDHGSRRSRRISANRAGRSSRMLKAARTSIEDLLLEYDEADLEEEALSDQDDFLMTGTHTEHDLRHDNLFSQSAYFTGTVVVIILLNTVVIALEAAYIEYQYVLFDQLERLFTLFYVVEIGWRIWEQGIIPFLSFDDWWWSWFDLLITSVSLADVCVSTQNGESAGASVGRLFRICRILRIFRAMKFMKEFDFVLAQTAQATLKLAIVVGLVLFVAAIIATNMLWDCPDPIVAGMFGDLRESLWSLFKLMTLDDWVPVCERVLKVKPGMIVFFVVFIFTTSIALISLIPAMFIEVSLMSRENEKTLNREREQRQHRYKKKRLLHTLFKLTDQNENGRVSVDEIKSVLQNDSYLRQLQDAGLTEFGDLRDVRLGLFEIYEETLEESANSNHEITEESFTNDLLRMREDISPLAVWRSTTATRLMLRDLSSFVRNEMREMRSNTRHLEKEMKQIIESAKAEIMNSKASIEFANAPSDNSKAFTNSSSIPRPSANEFQFPETLQDTVFRHSRSSIFGGPESEEIFSRTRHENMARNLSQEFTFNETPSVGGSDPVRPTSIFGGEASQALFGRRSEHPVRDIHEHILKDTPFVGGADLPPQGRLGEQPAACNVKEHIATPQGSLDVQGSRHDRVVASLGLSPRQPPARGTGGIGQVLMMKLTKDWGILPTFN